APHGAFDFKGIGSAANPAQIINNTSTCGFSQSLCGCNLTNTCASDLNSAYYTLNEINTDKETVVFQGNAAYDSPIDFQIDPNMSGGTTATINLKVYNNTFYASNAAPNSFGIGEGLAGTSLGGSVLDMRNNIFDG